MTSFLPSAFRRLRNPEKRHKKPFYIPGVPASFAVREVSSSG
jgi:hypothetical protein